MVPHQRRYVPGTMVVETTWHTPTGWLVVQDLLVIRKVDAGTRRPDYVGHLRTRRPEGSFFAPLRCISGRVEVEAVCIPLFDYGVGIGQWAYDGDGYGSVTRRRPAATTLSLESSLQLGIAGARCYGRTA